MTKNGSDSCLFCKIIKGDLPSYKIFETETLYAFLDIGPVARGHTLIVPKYHCANLHELPDEYLKDILPAAKKILPALGSESYNILQNNGKIAYQSVDHVHIHLIPKYDAEKGFGLAVDGEIVKVGQKPEGPAQDLAKVLEDIKGKL